ncbi:transcription initiation factor TFIID subunit 4b isoform X2 [Cicer arietinum]|uniref:Transcription initiation factor TFIID subunit 4b isoform X2 n=1 Tax=Cicer arietinum TaxID=3827 RepID=A0A3Q7YB84_CICAR|nr:transcription initiation factor TFIID subunit 4b isoform X2 [Cicer arietinum]
MDPSIVKLLEDDEDETMHSGADVEAFQAALNRDIGGDASNSQLSDLDAGSNNSFSQSLPPWPTSVHDNQSDCQNQEPEIAQQQEQPSSDMELKQQGPVVEQIQNVASQEASNLPLSHKQSQDECLQGQSVPASHQNSQTNVVPKSEKDPVFNHETIKTNSPNCESQYAKLQQMSNQQATVNEQPSSQINRSKQVPFGLLLPILIPQLAKDRAMQLQTLFNKLKRDEIPKDHFVRLMKGIVGDQMLRIALTKVQQQTRSNPSSSGQQHPVRMPTVTSSATKLNDPHALAQLHQRSMNAAADHSHTSSAVQVKSEPTYSTTDISAKKAQEQDVRVVQPNQLPLSSSNAVSQEIDRSSVHLQGLNKQQQQHIHFPGTYGSSGGSYSPFSGTTTGSSSSLRSQSHPPDSHIRQIPHQSTGLNPLGVERHSSFNDPKRMPGGSVSTVVNNTTSQQTSNSWQPSVEQNSGLFSSVSHVKKEPNDLSIEQQHRHHLSKLHGLPSVNSAQTEHGSGVNQGTVKDEFSRGSLASNSTPHTTSGSLPAPNSAPSSASQLDPTVTLSSQIPSSTLGLMTKTPLKKPPLGQKKPLEALGSSPPPPSKKQKVSGASMEQSIDQLNDVTAVSGVDLREEEEQLFSGAKEDSRVSEASRRVVQEEEESLILQKAPLQRKLIEIMTECGLKGMSNDVERCLSLCVEERIRGVISNIIRMSKQVDIEKTRHRTAVTSDVRQQIMAMNKKAREEWEKKQAEAEKLRKPSDVDGSSGVDGDKEKDEGRNKATKVNKEVDDKMRTNAANVAARAAVGGPDMLSKWQLMAEQARQKREGGMDAVSDSQPTKDVNRKSPSPGRSTKDNQERERKGPTSHGNSAAARKFGKNHSPGSQTRVARSISVKDVIAVLEREPQMSKSSLLYQLYERIHADASNE